MTPTEQPNRWAASQDPLTEHLVKIYWPGSVEARVCGHKFDPRTTPTKRNCQHCWFAFFAMNPQRVMAWIKEREAFGSISTLDAKAQKYFSEFTRQMAAFRAEQAAKQSKEVEIKATAEGQVETV
jgi:hypothetical protein